MTDELARLGALETAARVRAGDITALEAADAAIARIEARDGPVNAVPVRDFDRARDAARALDAAGLRGDPRPLVGVPMTLKDSHDVAGLPSSWGFESAAHAPVARDGAVAARLKAAGAVILGKTNVPVALADWQSVHPVHGRTCNPHDLSRSPGGSSGGAAAALAAGMVPLEVGSDIGGSIRVPAHFCGVFGHKPTWGIVPQRGHQPPGVGEAVDTPLAVIGPMARRAEDLSAALDVIAGPEGPGWRLDLPPPRVAGLAGARVLVLAAHPVAVASDAVLGVLEGLAEGLAAEGAEVIRAHPALPDLEALHRAYTRMLLCVLGRGAGAATVDAHGWMDMLDAQAAATRAWARLFEGVDAVLAPVLGVPAFPHDDEPDWKLRTFDVDGRRTPFGAQLAWPAMALLPGLPATAVPAGATAEGLPVGVQVICGPFEDRTAIALAGMMEAAGLVAARMAAAPGG